MNSDLKKVLDDYDQGKCDQLDVALALTEACGTAGQELTDRACKILAATVINIDNWEEVANLKKNIEKLEFLLEKLDMENVQLKAKLYDYMVANEYGTS